MRRHALAVAIVGRLCSFRGLGPRRDASFSTALGVLGHAAGCGQAPAYRQVGWPGAACATGVGYEPFARARAPRDSSRAWRRGQKNTSPTVGVVVVVFLVGGGGGRRIRGFRGARVQNLADGPTTLGAARFQFSKGPKESSGGHDPASVPVVGKTRSRCASVRRNPRVSFAEVLCGSRSSAGVAKTGRGGVGLWTMGHVRFPHMSTDEHGGQAFGLTHP